MEGEAEWQVGLLGEVSLWSQVSPSEARVLVAVPSGRSYFALSNLRFLICFRGKKSTYVIGLEKKIYVKGYLTGSAQ